MLATDKLELAFPGPGAPAFGDGPRCAGPSSRCARLARQPRRRRSRRGCRTIGGGLTATLPVAAGTVLQLNVGQGWPRGRF